MPVAPSRDARCSYGSVLAPSSNARCSELRFLLLLVASLLLVAMPVAPSSNARCS